MNWRFLGALQILLSEDQGAANYNEETSDFCCIKKMMLGFNVPSH